MPWEAHTEAGLLAGLGICWAVPEGLHPTEQTHAGAVNEELQPLGRTHIGEDCPSWDTGAQREVLPLRRKRQQCDKLTTTPIRCPVCHCQEGVENQQQSEAWEDGSGGGRYL